MRKINAWEKDFKYVKGKLSFKVGDLTKDLNILDQDYAPFPETDQWGNVKFKSLDTLYNSKYLKKHKMEI